LFVYEVLPGDTLGALSDRFGVEAERLRELNSLEATALVPGQALLVPSTLYTVQPGDSLWRIQQKTGVPWPAIARRNEITEETVLHIGRTLRIPPPPRRQAEVMGYLPLTDPGVTVASILPWAHLLTYLPIFSYLIDEQGTLTPVDDSAAIAEARRIGASPLLCIANMRTGGVFEPGIARAILTDAAIRRRVIDQVISFVEARGYDGVDSDIEAIPGDLRDAYANFLRELKARLGRRLLTLAAPPKWDEVRFAYAAGHDYAQLGQIADRIFVMNYEFHWVGGPPGPIAPLSDTRRVLLYATSQMPREKLLNGLLTTAYAWPLPDTPDNVARPMTDLQAVTLAQVRQVPIQYDRGAEMPWYRYRDEAGQEREVWFEDARSLLTKLMMIRDLGLQGIGIWQLGAFSPQLPPLISHLFQVGQQ
jgi:spore germination protein